MLVTQGGGLAGTFRGKMFPDEEVTTSAPPRSRSMAIQRRNYDINETGRMPDKRYNPFNRGGASRYKTVPRPTRERKWKQNPLMPTVSYVPMSVQLKEQPLLNVADPTMPDAISAEQILATNVRPPDTTVINAIPESRDYRQQLRTVNSMLDTRAQQRRFVRRQMDRLQPDRPQIVDIDAHRARHQPAMESNALADVIQQKIRGGIGF